MAMHRICSRSYAALISALVHLVQIVSQLQAILLWIDGDFKERAPQTARLLSAVRLDKGEVQWQVIACNQYLLLAHFSTCAGTLPSMLWTVLLSVCNVLEVSHPNADVGEASNWEAVQQRSMAQKQACMMLAL